MRTALKVKVCIPLRTAEDLPLDAIGALVAGTPVTAFIERYEASRKRR